MYGNIASSASVLFPPKEASDTAAATGSWTLVTNYEGAMLVTQAVGTVTAGTITGAIETAIDDSGGSSASVTGATFTAVTTATDQSAQTIIVPCNSCKQYVRYVGTVATGPAVVSASIVGTPKY